MNNVLVTGASGLIGGILNTKLTEHNLFGVDIKKCDYENFEMKFFKENHNKQIESGTRAWWEFNKVLNRSENANQEVTHFTMDVIDKDYQWSNDGEPSFTEQMMVKYGVASRERVIGDRMSVLFAKFQQN